MNIHVVAAIFRRNLLSYFSNPTGYVFICLFVVLSSFFAFWPYEFFNANLANLDQLNRYLPYILLLFIPAITMSIWADERRQGTDELLLTLPAGDIDVVLGKYFAAVAVFTVALIFSMFCNLLMLRELGHPDIALFAANYFGYWLVGLAMLATGMVASFLTGNLTVAFILGVVFNAPLVLADLADTISGSAEWTMTIKRWGLAEQFRDFGRGVISLSAIIYYLMIVVVMLYLCMVLIGRRHWMGGRDGHSLLGHYLARALALGAAAVALVLIFSTFDMRYDVTAEKVSSLSPDTVALVRDLDTKGRAVSIKAYISPDVPENYVQTRLNLLNDLREFEKLGRGRIQVQVISTEPTTEEANKAEQQFGIRSHPVLGRSRGAPKDEQIFLGVAVTCGLEKVVVPFFDRGTPIEYELIRSIVTVAQQKRKRLGVVQTDAPLFSGFDMQAMTVRPSQPIIDELSKQYEVVQVDASKPIEKFDVLMAVQPSSLEQPKLNNLLDAIRNGQPTAIFEDPAPVFMQGVPGTSEEKRGPMGQPGGAKADIQQLWSLLGVKPAGKERTSPFGPVPSSAGIVWQDWNPYPKLSFISTLPLEFVFIGREEPGAGGTAFNDADPITSGLQELWLPFPGAVLKQNNSKMKFVPLVNTGDKTGLIPADQLRMLLSDTRSHKLEGENTTNEVYTLAARITGELKSSDTPSTSDAANADKAKADDSKSADPAGKDAAGKDAAPAKSTAAEEAAKKRAARQAHPLDVVLVMDIDMMESNVFAIRSRSDEEEIGVHFDNIVFVLNTLDVLAGDERFVEIRKRKPAHRTLTTIDQAVNDYRDRVTTAKKEYNDKYTAELQKARAEGEETANQFRQLQKKVTEAQQAGEDVSTDLQVQIYDAMVNKAVADARTKAREDQLEREHRRQLDDADRDFNSDIRHEQNYYKFLAVLIPPIAPFIVAIFVFFSRRAQEREGVSKSRLR
jgi:ABC-2 type transport system permease protein